MLYLASPYSHEDPAVIAYRSRAAREAALRLKQSGLVVFSPVVYGEQFPELPGDWASWRFYCLGWLAPASALVVLQLDGWAKSTGVTAEIQFAREKKKPIFYLRPSDAGI